MNVVERDVDLPARAFIDGINDRHPGPFIDQTNIFVAARIRQTLLNRLELSDLPGPGIVVLQPGIKTETLTKHSFQIRHHMHFTFTQHLLQGHFTSCMAHVTATVFFWGNLFYPHLSINQQTQTVERQSYGYSLCAKPSSARATGIFNTSYPCLSFIALFPSHATGPLSVRKR